MIYTLDGKVRYSEVSENGNITVEALVNYLQDAVMLHSEYVGDGMKSLYERREGWFLSAWQIDIEKIPMVYDEIKVHTSPYDFKGGFGSRNFWIEDCEGQRMIAANSYWIFMDLDKMCPKKVTEEASAPYLPMIPRIDMEYLPRKINVPAECVPLKEIVVTREYIDTNHHVNNCKYIVAAMRTLELFEVPKRIRAEYKKAAVLGNVFCPFYIVTDGNYTVDLRDENGASYAVITIEYNIGE